MVLGMSNGISPSTWFTCLKQNPGASLRLFCFSYAGGAAHVFRPWADSLPDWIELYAANLPGRGNRLREPLYTSLTQLTQSLAQAIECYLDKRFAFFGHSMGALLSFELCRQLRRARGIEPDYLFASAHRAPHLKDPGPAVHRLPDAEFLEKLRELNGTPPEILENTELIEFMLPILRADFQMLETYTYLPDFRLNCPLEAYGGIADKETGHDELSAWRDHTSNSFAQRMFPGDHFFIHTARESLLHQIVRALGQLKAVDQPHRSAMSEASPLFY
jgi:medium-chain acyl-[acyl-carrier-protein] hydrolase